MRAGRLLSIAGGLSVAALAHAGVISDASYFNPLPTTLIDFETDGLGSPVSLIEGQIMLMPAAEYASVGVTFSPQVYWVNDASGDFDSAQALGGSLDNAIPSSAVNTFTINFSVPVQAFGLWVVNNSTADPNGPTFTARDGSNQVIESVQFNGALVDGTVGVASYGFMGIFSPTQISSVTITKQAAIFDDLRFSTAPTPGALGVLGVAGLLAKRRRR